MYIYAYRIQIRQKPEIMIWGKNMTFESGTGKKYDFGKKYTPLTLGNITRSI